MIAKARTALEGLRIVGLLGAAGLGAAGCGSTDPVRTYRQAATYRRAALPVLWTQRLWRHTDGRICSHYFNPVSRFRARSLTWSRYLGPPLGLVEKANAEALLNRARAMLALAGERTSCGPERRWLDDRRFPIRRPAASARRIPLDTSRGACLARV